LGDRIAYAKMDTLKDSYSLVTVDTTGSFISETPTLFPAFFIYWSPDDTRIAFLTNYKSFALQLGLQYIDLALEPTKALSLGKSVICKRKPPYLTPIILDTGRPYFITWSPRGNPSLFVHRNNSKLEIIDLQSANDGQVSFEKKLLNFTKMKEVGKFSAPFWVARETTEEMIGSGVTELLYAMEDGSKKRKHGELVLAEVALVQATIKHPLSAEEMNKMNLTELRSFFEEYNINPPPSSTTLKPHEEHTTWDHNNNDNNSTRTSEERQEYIKHLEQVFRDRVLLKEEVLLRKDVEAEYFSFLCSSDGTKVAYSGYIHHLELLETEKLYQDPTNYKPKLIATRVLGYFWSPNNRYVLYLVLVPDARRDLKWCIYDSLLSESYDLHTFMAT
jgi:hypothetical protein